MTIGWPVLIGGALCLLAVGVALGVCYLAYQFGKGFHW